MYATLLVFIFLLNMKENDSWRKYKFRFSFFGSNLLITGARCMTFCMLRHIQKKPTKFVGNTVLYLINFPKV